MLQQTYYTVSEELMQEARLALPNIDSRLAINQPTGKFFSDPWEIKLEFKGTVWEKILDKISEDKGEARLIKLLPGECYPSHADIDDRWHLSLTGNNSFLIDLENNIMHQTNVEGQWFLMNAGVRHTAANFGSEDRVQLVVRKLLPTPQIKNPKTVSIKLKQVIGERRFVFDDIISPWLNKAYKLGIVDNFKGEDLEAKFTVEESYIAELRQVIDYYFTLTIE
jgi:hypothetical protein